MTSGRTAHLASDACASVVVVIPCYESRRFLWATVESVLQQTRPPNAVVVVDDGSTDGSISTINDLVANSGIVQVVQQRNAGCGAARNRGSDLIGDCEFVLFLDADDVLESTMLERLAGVLRDTPSAAMAWCMRDTIDDRGQLIAKASWPTRHRRVGRWRTAEVPRSVSDTSFASLFACLHEVPEIVPSVSLIRVSTFVAAGRWDAAFGHGFEDIDLFLRLRLRGDVLFVPEQLVLYRCHGSQWSASADRGREQERKFRARWRSLEGRSRRERQLVVHACRFYQLLVMRRAWDAARERVDDRELRPAVRELLIGLRLVAQSRPRGRWSRSVSRWFSTAVQQPTDGPSSGLWR